MRGKRLQESSRQLRNANKRNSFIINKNCQKKKSADRISYKPNQPDLSAIIKDTLMILMLTPES